MRKRNNRKKKNNGLLHKNDWCLLACAAIFLAFSLIKCSNLALFSGIRDEFTSFFQGGTAVSAMAENIGEKVKASSSEIFSGDTVKAFAEKFFSEDDNPSTLPEDKSSEDELLSSSYASELSLPSADIFQNEHDPENVSRQAFFLPFSYQRPVNGILSCAFGYRLHPIDQVVKFHYGIDLAAKEGTPIYAFATGTVTECGENSIYGNYFVLSHTDAFSTFYGHCSKLLVHTGQTVVKGQKIAYVGNTGKSTGSHLHFEIRKEAFTLDPTYYVHYDAQI